MDIDVEPLDSTNGIQKLPDIPASRTLSQESIEFRFENLWIESPLTKASQKYNLPATESDESLLKELQNLFKTISHKKKRIGVHGPKQFIMKLKSQNGYYLNKKYFLVRCNKMPMNFSIF